MDTVAVADALNHSRIAGETALNVFEQRPLGEQHPLLKCANVILTSHVAWYSEMSVLKLQKMAAQAAIRALGGKPDIIESHDSDIEQKERIVCHTKFRSSKWVSVKCLDPKSIG